MRVCVIEERTIRQLKFGAIFPEGSAGLGTATLAFLGHFGHDLPSHVQFTYLRIGFQARIHELRTNFIPAASISTPEAWKYPVTVLELRDVVLHDHEAPLDAVLAL